MKPVFKKMLCLTILLVLLATALGACAPKPTAPPQAATKTLVIGEIETLTGASSDNLKLAASGAYLAQQYINKHGGITINGDVYMVEIKLEDNGGTADGASAAATKLIQQDHVMFVTGSGPPPLTNAIGAVAEPAGVLYAS